MGHLRAFTLIELLVVITIIVVLLALLTPALDQAFYQTELTLCSANQRAITMSAIEYAHANRRRYLSRPGLDSATTPYAFLMPITLQHPEIVGYDIRPMLRDKMGLSINKTMMCPLVSPIDVETAPLPDEVVMGNQALYFGWKYIDTAQYTNRGMFRLGDRLQWESTSTSLLVCDFEMNTNQTGPQASHPDRDAGLMYNNKAVRAMGAGLAMTLSYWQGAAGGKRGGVDNNYAYDDGSTKRVLNVGMWEPFRLDRLPDTYGNNRPGVGFQIPMEGRR